ncbi:MAG TPA: Rieske 2Fe-2S domain-containing protein [Blastocatellia bacterium]
MKMDVEEPPDEAIVPERRTFLGVVIAGIGAAITAVLAVTIGRYAVGPSLKSEDQSVWTDAGLLEDLPDGNWVKRNVIVSQDAGWGKFNSQRPVWVRKTSQQCTVFSATCPHLGCTINESAGGFICPCHGSAWNMDGHKLGGPSPRDMDSLESRDDGDTLQVKYEYFKQGIPEKVAAG